MAIPPPSHNMDRSYHDQTSNNASAAAPPSTLAAQLAYQRAIPDKPRNRELFNELLREIHDSPVDSDPDTNLKLVSIVADHGLVVPIRQAPAGNGDADDNVAKLEDCIAIIDAIVRQTPEILLMPEDGSTEPTALLCFLLLSRANDLLPHDRSRAHAVDLFRLLKHVLSPRQSPWAGSSRLYLLIRAALEQLITALGSWEPRFDDDGFTAHLSLPSVSMLSMLNTSATAALVALSGRKLIVRSVPHALMTMTGMLLVLTGTCAQSQIQELSPPSVDTIATVKVAATLSTLMDQRQAVRDDAAAMHCSLTMLLEAMIILGAVNDIPVTLRSLCLSMLLTTMERLAEFDLTWSDNAVTECLLKACFVVIATSQRPAVKDGSSQERLARLFNNASTSGFLDAVSDPVRQRIELLRRAADTGLASGPQIDSRALGAWADERPKGVSALDFPFGEIQDSPVDPDERNPKRRRTGGLETHESLDTLVRSLCALFVNWNPAELVTLKDSAAALFADFTYEMQVEAFDIFGRIQCTSAANHQTAKAEPANAYLCSFCQQGRRRTDDSLLTRDDETLSSVAATLVAVMETETVLQSKSLRVSGLIAIQRLACHSALAKVMDLTCSDIGKICLKGFKSSLRELRMVCSRTLAMFLKADVDFTAHSNLAQGNRRVALKFLHDLESDDERMLETIIEAFGHAFIVCEEDGAHLILHELLEFLGHANPYISAQAHLELRRLAAHFDLKLLELLRPHWNVLAVPIVQDILSKPQMAQQVADLLGTSVNDLLLQTQSYILPSLICNDQLNIVRRIAEAKGPALKPYDICIQGANLPAIISYLALNYRGRLESAVASCFSKLEPSLSNADLDALAKADPVGTARELLKSIAMGPEAEWVETIPSFRELAGLVERRGAGQATRNQTTQSRMTISFFTNHALGLMASFSDAIESPTSLLIEKKRNLLAIGCMIEVAKQEKNEEIEMQKAVPIPQIRACLQSAFNHPALSNDAFAVWLRLLTVVEHEELHSLIIETFTLVVRRWDSFSAQSRQKAYIAIEDLLMSHNDIFMDAIDILPSLASIPMMDKFQKKITILKNRLDIGQRISAFAQRCDAESEAAVKQALDELLPYLQANEQWIHENTSSEQPSPAIPDLLRALLDICARFPGQTFLDKCTQSLGVIGCVDVNRVEVTREQNHMVILSNFTVASEAIDFATFLLQNVLVKAFRSVTNPRAQGFLAYVMQELLRFCGFSDSLALNYRQATDDRSRRWLDLSEDARGTLTPFLSSRYVLTTSVSGDSPDKSEPIFSVEKSHGQWLRDLTLQLLSNAKGDNAVMIFKVLARVIRGYDLSIAALLLPFAAANIVIDGTPPEGEEVGREMLMVLQQPTNTLTQQQIEQVKHCSHNVFDVLDYLSRWLQEKRRHVMENRLASERQSRRLNQADEAIEDSRLAKVESFLKIIPPQVISNRAQECGSFTRALLHWEQHMRQTGVQDGSQGCPGTTQQLQHLQDLYTKIDDPDGIDGVGAIIFFNNPMQQVLEHQRAGRWDAAKTWYELELGNNPADSGLHTRYLDCLLQASDYSAILKHASAAQIDVARYPKIMSAISHASWSTGRWDLFESLSAKTRDNTATTFDTAMGSALLSLRQGREQDFKRQLQDIRFDIARHLSNRANPSVLSTHDLLLQLHAVHETESFATIRPDDQDLKPILIKRLEIMGSGVADKQFILGLRRALLQITRPNDKLGLAASWIKTAKLARKSLPSSLAYEAIYYAASLNDETAKIEHAKLLWNAGEHRRALQGLLVALQNNKFADGVEDTGNGPTLGTGHIGNVAIDTPQNALLAKAQLTYAKWVDQAGQSSSEEILQRYRAATYSFQKWEMGFYFLGKFYNKLLDSERAQPIAKQSYRFLGGEMSKLVVENYLRSMTFGSRNVAQSLPKMLTLWLELGENSQKPWSREIPDDVKARASEQRPKMMSQTNNQVRKYFEKIIAFVFYTGLAQMLTRITHTNPQVWTLLSACIVKVASSFPQQALWSVLATFKATDPNRQKRGAELITRIKDKNSRTVRNEGQSIDLKDLVTRGQALTTELIRLCDAQLEARPSKVSLTHQIGFKTRVVPCPLVVPYEKMLTASLPTGQTDFGAMRAHRAFPASREAVTITSIDDEVLVLSSLQRPRKLTLRGSDGRVYGIMCKPHDDLRKDQRLMEFNGLINRALKKDSESSLRRLQIGTYAVTPLNETNGVLEWVEGLRPMRDILLSLYKSKGIKIDYNLLKELLNEACKNPPESTAIFTETILPQYKPVLHEWFTEHFPAPDAWYAARVRYSRSCAASSMVGHALGLGDRHGENVLLVERNGSVFHVDFNCLFEKGLTFEKPELVPFRLTHNMVDAMGSTGVEGYFRRAAECTMRMMREQEDVLLTNLETFVYDPTADYVGRRSRSYSRAVPQTPREVLDSVRNKVEGYMHGESLRLSVQGHVEALIKQARNPTNLASMYIGWCAFL